MGEDGGLSPIVRQALHLVALDEERLAFRPTLLNAQDNVEEIWMPGVHSDVGGGFRLDGLSDIALEAMITRGRDVGLDFIDPQTFPEGFQCVDQEGTTVSIERRDLSITPDFEATIHRQDRGNLSRRLTLRPRQLLVLRDGQPSPQDRPVIHHSVVQRIQVDPEYRPASLQGVAHLVLGKDGTTAFGGLADHV